MKSTLRAPAPRPFFRLAVLLGLLGLALAATASAQTASLVRDIDNARPWQGTARADDLLGLSGRVLFFGDEPAVADGGGASSELLADLCPGPLASTPRFRGRMGDLAFFSASATGDAADSWLYRSDGTRAGTYPLGPIANNFAVAGDHVFFVNRRQLWVSDGSVAGTRQVPLPDQPIQQLSAVGRRVFLVLGSYDLWVSDGSAAGTFLLHSFTFAEGPWLWAGGTSRLYFMVSTSSDASALWTSDGTPGGTRQVAGFPLARGFVPPLRILGDQAYLAIDDQVHGQELWTSDGTAPGSRRVSELADPAPFGTVFGLPAPPVAVVSGRLIFATQGGVFATTGTPASTTLLAPVGKIADFVQVGARLLFLGAVQDGIEVWATDGTPPGTRRLARTCSGSCFNVAGGLVASPSAAFFPVIDGPGTALWTSDGTAAGTRPYTSTLPPFLLLRHFAAIGRQIFFLAGATAQTPGPWTSDGLPGGTHPVPGVTTTGAGSRPQDLVAGGGRLLFTACDGTSRQVWKSDGTAAGTVPLTSLTGADCSEELFNFPEPRGVTPVGSLAFFWFLEDSQWHLWRTDDGGNALDLIAIHLFSVDNPPPLVPFGGKIYFSSGGSVYRSDGTRAGTGPATELALPSSSGLGGTAGGLLFFWSSGAAADPSAVWASDGTAAGTRSLLAGAFSGLSSPVQAGAWIYFFTAGSDGLVVWRTDGSAAGTSRVGTLGPDQSFFLTAIPPTVVLGDAVYFLGNFSLGRGLYRIAPTGVSLLKPLSALAFSFPEAQRPAVLGGRLFFADADESHGPALWSTDGTAAGTVLVRAIGSSLEPAQIGWLTPAGGRLFFAAWDAAHGTELWESDGTAAGTRLAADVAPEGASSAPQALTVSGDRLYFTADDGVAGREVWSLPLTGPAGCQPSDTRLCLAGNRFQVEVDWKDFQGHTGVGHAVPLTADTGTFWFFDPANVELVIKVLDGRSLNQAFWVFYGALSTVEYEITVTDTQTGLSRRYVNPSGQLASVGDTNGFGPQGAFDTKALVAPPSALPLVAARTDPRAATGSCAASPGTLCLQGNRFAVTAAWKDFSGHTGTGTAVPLTGDTGYFWFFSSTNVEVVAKVLDGRPVNDKFWLFYGALSNVEYTLTVTDTQTGAVKTYRNPLGQFGSVADTGAF